MQQGRYAGTLIHRCIGGNPASPPFRYFDKGNMAVVGKGFAVLQSGKLQISGWLAWLAWAAVHLEFLGTSNLRVSVFVQWVWTYLTGQRGSRIIVHHHAPANDDAPASLPAEHEPNAPASASESSSPPDDVVRERRARFRHAARAVQYSQGSGQRGFTQVPQVVSSSGERGKES